LTLILELAFGVWHYELVKDQTTSVEEIKEDAYRIYPNPVTGLLNVECPTGEHEVVVYDVNGRLINQFMVLNEHLSYNMSQLPLGLYIVEIRNEESVKAFKVVKK